MSNSPNGQQVNKKHTLFKIPTQKPEAILNVYYHLSNQIHSVYSLHPHSIPTQKIGEGIDYTIMNTFTHSKKKQNLFSDYCQYLLASFTNFTQTYFADHSDKWSHDQINRFLRNENIPSSELWQSVKDDIEYDDEGYLIFDDIVLSKPHANEIEVVRSQWSGSEKQVVEGIGIVTCIYVNPKTQAYWVIDYRLFDKDHDGKSKIDHLLEMMHNAYFKKQLPFRIVLMDSWYASMKVMKAIERLSKIYYLPLKRNRLVNDTDGVEPHQQVQNLSWTDAEIRQGKRVHINKFPKGHQVKLFRIVSSNGGTVYIATNDLSQSDADAALQEYSVRWKIELLHRELKQVTGIDKCQCRKLRAQRNHIACCFQVWVCMKRFARSIELTIYKLKDSLLDDYLKQQLSNPSIIFNNA